MSAPFELPPFSYEGRGDFIAIVRQADDVEVARVMWNEGEPVEDLQARAAAICDALNGAANVKRYDERLSEWELAPNGDDYNAVCAQAQGGGYSPPHKGGR